MKSKQSKNDLVVKSIKLAKNIKDKNKQNICIGSIFAFVYRYLNETEINDILEVLKVTDLGSMLIKEGIEQEKIAIAKKTLNEGASLEFVQKITDLDTETIKELKEQIGNK